jgi:plastocyanin
MRAWVIAMLLVSFSARADEAKPAVDDTGDRVKGKSEALRDGAKWLDKAEEMRAKGNKNLAEQFFSQAELLVGADVLADLAPVFREGAPPRVTTPTKVMKDEGPQPKTVGNSEDDEPKPVKKRVVGSLAGVMNVEGGEGGIGVVTMTPIGRKSPKRTPKQRVMEQRNREFAPHILAIPVGSTVSFPNFDAQFHNVFSTSDVARFDLGLYKNGESRDYVFNKEGIIRIGCNLHATMSAWIVVVSAPLYSITNEKGEFAFPTLEPGKYELKAWNERSLEPVTQTIVIKEGKNELQVGVKGDAPTGLQPDKFGGARGGKK